MLIMSFMNSEKEALDLPAIVTGNGEAYPKQWLGCVRPPLSREENKCSPKHYGN